MHIYYSNDGERIGPKKLEDLKPHELAPDTLVWHKGMKEWADASTVPELATYFEAQPFISKMEESPQVLHNNMIFLGVFHFFVPVVLFLLNLAFLNEYFASFSIAAFLGFRIHAIYSIYKTATAQFRKVEGWLIVGIFIPATTLVILGILPTKQIESDEEVLDRWS